MMLGEKNLQRTHPIIHNFTKSEEEQSSIPHSKQYGTQIPYISNTQSTCSSLINNTNKTFARGVRNVVFATNEICGNEHCTLKNLLTLSAPRDSPEERFEEVSRNDTINGTEISECIQMIPIRPCHCIPGRVPAHQLDCTALPPSYEDADVHSVEPLTYESYFGKIYDTPTSCTSLIGFIIQIFQFLLALTLRIILCLVIIVIPLSMIAIGFVYINDCPAEPCIPIFLIIGGLFSFVKYIIGIVRIVEKNDRDEN